MNAYAIRPSTGRYNLATAPTLADARELATAFFKTDLGSDRWLIVDRHAGAAQPYAVYQGGQEMQEATA